QWSHTRLRPLAPPCRARRNNGSRNLVQTEHKAPALAPPGVEPRPDLRGELTAHFRCRESVSSPIGPTRPAGILSIAVLSSVPKGASWQGSGEGKRPAGGAPTVSTGQGPCGRWPPRYSPSAAASAPSARACPSRSGRTAAPPPRGGWRGPARPRLAD